MKRKGRVLQSLEFWKRAATLLGLLGLSAFLIWDTWREAAEKQAALRARLGQNEDTPHRAPAGVPSPGVSELASAMQRMLAASGAKPSVDFGRSAKLAGEQALAFATGEGRGPASGGRDPHDAPLEPMDAARELHRLTSELDRVDASNLAQRSQLLWQIADLAAVDREEVFQRAMRELEGRVPREAQGTEEQYNHTVLALRVAINQSQNGEQAVEAFRLAAERANGREQRVRILKYFEMHAAFPGAAAAANQALLELHVQDEGRRP